MNWCRLIGHKWDYYNDDVTHMTTGGVIVKINTWFRYCAKCHTNQTRINFTGDEYTDWDNCELNVDQLRDKKLKELGI